MLTARSPEASTFIEPGSASLGRLFPAIRCVEPAPNGMKPRKFRLHPLVASLAFAYLMAVARSGWPPARMARRRRPPLEERACFVPQIQKKQETPRPRSARPYASGKDDWSEEEKNRPARLGTRHRRGRLGRLLLVGRVGEQGARRALPRQPPHTRRHEQLRPIQLGSPHLGAPLPDHRLLGRAPPTDRQGLPGAQPRRRRRARTVQTVPIAPNS